MFCVVGVYRTSAIDTVDHDIVLDRLRHRVSILGSALDLCLRDLFLWLPLSSAPLLLFLHMVQCKVQMADNFHQFTGKRKRSLCFSTQQICV